MIIGNRALDTVKPIVGLHDQQYLVRVRRDAVVVFIPYDRDRILALGPNGRLLDRRYEPLDGSVAKQHQGRVQICLTTVRNRIEVAIGTRVTTPMLIVALIWG